MSHGERLTTGHLLRTGIEPEETADDEAAIPEKCLHFSELPPEDGFAGCFALSFDWEEHPACGDYAAVLARSSGRGDTHVYRIETAQASAKIEHQGKPVELEAWHWPENGNDSHTNLVARPGVGKGTRKSVRVHLRRHLHVVFSQEENT